MSDKTVNKLSLSEYLSTKRKTTSMTNSTVIRPVLESTEPSADGCEPPPKVTPMTSSQNTNTDSNDIQYNGQTDEEEEVSLRRQLAEIMAETDRVNRQTQEMEEKLANTEAAVILKKAVLDKETQRRIDLEKELERLIKDYVRAESELKQETIKAKYESEHVIEPNLKLIREKSAEAFESYRKDLEEECRLSQEVKRLELQLQEKKRFQASATEIINSLTHLRKYKDQLEVEVNQLEAENFQLDQTNQDLITKLRVEDNRLKAKSLRYNKELQRKQERLTELKELVSQKKNKLSNK